MPASEAENNLIIENQFLLAVIADRDRRIETLETAMKRVRQGDWHWRHIQAILNCALDGLYWKPSEDPRPRMGAGGWMGGGKPQEGVDPAASIEKGNPC